MKSFSNSTVAHVLTCALHHTPSVTLNNAVAAPLDLKASMSFQQPKKYHPLNIFYLRYVTVVFAAS